MLVLSRKKGESIIIGHDIEIVVLGTEGETVRLGIKAPRSVEVNRKEIYDAIQESNREAVNAQVPLADLRKLMGGQKADKENDQ
ncbi:carbon storage regulator CsrA [Cohnella sp. JJ-181]|uniref:carbon storage regulator CsrA n=1 Tax=Cohnella rhizoplanae TaxID=2974897 RepID=UPI0022FFAF84|nr:carbon storage regulator CsrA [Cohnella sp. JJ-181]CAI6084339.1 Translational regulator CsrA [Cohnella sp. JJ-181]